MIIHASEYSERKQFNPYVAIGGGGIFISF